MKILAPLLTSIQLLIGSYTDKNAGMEFYLFQPEKKSITKLYEIAQANASFQTFSKNKEYLFSVTENGEQNSSVSSYLRQANGHYSLLNTFPTLGLDPCHLTFRESSQTLYVANYSSGNVSVFKTDHGKLYPIQQLMQYQGKSVNINRQNSPHAHKVVFSPDNRYLFVTDLGTDRMYQHRILEDGSLEKQAKIYYLEAGDGPRHLVFHPNGKFAYLINELSGMVDVFLYKNGQLEKVQRIANDDSKSKEKGSAHIEISPDWNWLIVSNRITNNELVVYKILPSGQLIFNKKYPVAKKPRHFNFDPSGKFIFVASQDENKVVIYHFDPKTGLLKPFNLEFAVHAPVSIQAVY